MSSPKSTTDSQFVPAQKVCLRYGVTFRTISRWLVHPNVQFPKPIYLNGRRYWIEADLQEWEAVKSPTSP